MFPIHFVARPDSDQPVVKETSVATNLDDAKAGARTRIKNIRMAGPSVDPARPLPIGFLIFDATGTQLLHREYVA